MSPTAPHPKERQAGYPGGGLKTFWGEEGCVPGERKQCATHPNCTPVSWMPEGGPHQGRGLTAVGPGQVPGAADIHEGAGWPVWPAGIVIKGSVAEQVWVQREQS